MRSTAARLAVLGRRNDSAADPLTRTLPFVLGVIGGATDTIGFLGMGGLFTAHITGNVVVLAAHLVVGDPAVISYILAVPVFMAALLLSVILANGLARAGIASLWPLLLVELLALGAFFSLGVTEGPWKNLNAAPAILAGMCGVAAMAVQSALVQIALKGTPTTNVMTTNVTYFMLDLGTVVLGGEATEIAKAKSRALCTLPVILCFAFGCALGAALETAAGLWSLIMPMALVLFAFAMAVASAGSACRGAHG